MNTFGLTDAKKGPVSIFGPQGKLALMFLKHYACCSDKRLVGQLNGNIDHQFFCGIHLGNDRLSNYKIVSEILMSGSIRPLHRLLIVLVFKSITFLRTGYDTI